MKSLYNWGLAGLLCSAMAAFTTPVSAQILDVVPEEDAQVTEEGILTTLLKDLNVSGFVDTNYFYNDEAPAGQDSLTPLNFIGENENHSLTFESFALFLDKEATDEHPIGWQLHTYFGEKAKRITFLGEEDTNDVDRDDIFTVATANVSWIAPIGKGITFTFGKIYTWIGAELVENINNPNYQHGTLYNNAIPFTHTGMSASYDLTDTVSLTLYGVNGWDSFIDNNSSKSWGWYLTYTPTDRFFISLAGIHGAEGWDNEAGPIPANVQRTESNGGFVSLFDLVTTYQLTSNLAFMLNVDWGQAEDAGLDIANGVATGNTGHWFGVAPYAMYDFTDWIQGVIRYEYFDDRDGVRFFDQTIWDVTLTLNIEMRENLLFRPEYRYIHYSDPDAIGVKDSSANIYGIGIEYIF
ncbi:MAG: hypothetical protein E3K32_01475 [wastewater metagenome]|nr:hypothetical protein [Candidatus Loosdrechtia aerotolerans]